MGALVALRRALVVLAAVMLPTAGAVSLPNWIYGNTYVAMTDNEAFNDMSSQYVQATEGNAIYKTVLSRNVSVDLFVILNGELKNAVENREVVSYDTQQWDKALSDGQFKVTHAFGVDGFCYHRAGDIRTASPAGAAKYTFTYDAKNVPNGLTISIDGVTQYTTQTYTEALQKAYNTYSVKCFRPNFYQYLQVTGNLQPASVGRIWRPLGAAYFIKSRKHWYPPAGWKIGPAFVPADDVECTPEICTGYDPLVHSGGPSVPPAGGTDWGSAPKDDETSCGIIDIPCNLKKLFIPRKTFLTEKLAGGLGFNVSFPVTVVDNWSMTLNIAGKPVEFKIPFDWLEWDEKTKDQFRFYVWWGNFLFLLAFVGVPFMSNKSASAGQAASMGKSAGKQATANPFKGVKH